MDKTVPNRYLPDYFIESAEKYPDKLAIAVEGVEYTYRQLKDKVQRLATALLARGLKRGDRVAIYMDNTMPCIVSVYATMYAGGAFLIINPQTKADKLEYILKDCGAYIVLSDTHLSPVLQNSVVKLSQVKTLVCSGDSEKLAELNPADNQSIEYFDTVIDDSEPLGEHKNITPTDLAALIYTSGSTGNPKGVMHTHLSMTFALGSLIEYLRLKHEHVFLNVLPFAFDYGLYQLFMSMSLGSTLVLERSFTYPAVIFKRIEQYKVSVFPGVPTIYSMLLTAHARKKLCFPSVERITNTAAALPAEYSQALKEIFPNALIYKMYGLTECKRVCYLEPELVDEKPDSVGRAIPGTEAYLLTTDGKPVETAGELGILHVRGPHLMLGYWNLPDVTAHMIKEGTFPGERILCTHDWFKMDEDGHFYFVGRSDDIIKTRGEKVSPIEVENVLHGISGIQEAAVVGVDDETLGQTIRAYVSIEAGSDLSDKKIRKLCMSKLENFMVPQEVIILDSLPKTNTGKISKKDL